MAAFWTSDVLRVCEIIWNGGPASDKFGEGNRHGDLFSQNLPQRRRSQEQPLSTRARPTCPLPAPERKETPLSTESYLRHTPQEIPKMFGNLARALWKSFLRFTK